MGYPGGNSLRINTRFSGEKENLAVYFWGKRQSLLHPNTAQQSFFPLQSFSRKTLGKIGPKSARTERVYRIVLMPPGHPIIFLKSS